MKTKSFLSIYTIIPVISISLLLLYYIAYSVRESTASDLSGLGFYIFGGISFIVNLINLIFYLTLGKGKNSKQLTKLLIIGVFFPLSPMAVSLIFGIVLLIIQLPQIIYMFFNGQL